MASSTPNTIVLRGNGLRSEAPAESAITPGMLIGQLANGNYQPHQAAGGEALPAVAVENELLGQGIDDDYGAGENVLVDTLQNGSLVYGLLNTGQNVAANASLESAGNGMFTVLTTGVLLGFAIEAVDATSAAKRIKVTLKG